MNKLDQSSALMALNAVADRLTGEPSEGFYGRGIVICAGGMLYFTCAWVCINMLRALGCQLPVELWYLGPREVNDSMKALIEPLGVKCVDGYEIRKVHPARILNGWELKPYAIIHSKFREVLFLDADNVPVVDPEPLFATNQFRDHGAIFWPDFGRLGGDRKIWQLTGIEYRDEPEFETGQIVVDKVRCWDALQLTMWMNENSDFWYQYIHGDKETFHMAWRKLKIAYAMPTRGIDRLRGTMCQHDFESRRVFQHRNLAKWSLDANRHVPGFEHEDQCLQFLTQLRNYHRNLAGVPPFDARVGAKLAGQRRLYKRIGYDQRAIRFESDGTVSEGCARLEKYWRILEDSERSRLEIWGDDGLTAEMTLVENSVDTWRGAWKIHERMPVEIAPITPP
ncbi:MAG: hypothetical protein H7144_09575 [Burkholderiales bacterium]|nr:hypothetical protein [Phycisphaerae bacterium]